MEAKLNFQKRQGLFYVRVVFTTACKYEKKILKNVLEKKKKKVLPIAFD